MSEITSKSRILFVDDDQAILDGLRRLLRPMRHRWDLHFACGGRAGLEAMDTAPPDVLVTDMRMPEVDGTALLKHARRQHPRAVRIVLSGHTELEDALRTLSVAHRFLVKPCDPQQLEAAIDRACSLNSILEDHRVAAFFRSIGGLPEAPAVYQQVTDDLSRTSGPSELSRIIEQDPDLCVRILERVNSNCFALPRRVADIETAIANLGSPVVRALVLAVEAHHWLEAPTEDPGTERGKIQQRSLVAARLSRGFLRDDEPREEAFTASLLVDVGQLVLERSIGNAHEALQHAAESEGRPQWELEVERIGVHHCEVGAYLLGQWGLPYSIIEAVAHHHLPSATSAREFDVLGAVHLADFFARAQTERATALDGELDLEYLERVGWADRIPGLRSRAHEEVGGRE